MTDELTARVLDELVALRRLSGGVETEQEVELRNLLFRSFDRRSRTLEDSLESLQSRVLRLESATAN